MKAKIGIDMCQNEIANAVIENRTTAPENPKTGQFYYNTTHSRLYVYNGTDWVNFNPTEAYAFAKAVACVIAALMDKGINILADTLSIVGGFGEQESYGARICIKI